MFTTFPAGPLLCKFVANVDRKFCKLAELLVSPSVVTIFAKLVSRFESAVLSLEVLELPEEVVNCEIRLCRLEARAPGPPVALVLALAEVLLLSLLPCACNAAIRLCRKLPIACAALSPDVDELGVELLDALLALVPVLSLCDPMPIEESASEIAPSNPPPPLGGGGGRPFVLLLVSVLPDCDAPLICDNR